MEEHVRRLRRPRRLGHRGVALNAFNSAVVDLKQFDGPRHCPCGRAEVKEQTGAKKKKGRIMAETAGSISEASVSEHPSK